MAESEIERLYGLRLEQFTTARDELVRELRRAGDRAAADEIRKLRKPSVAAWALNQLQRRDGAAVGRLIAAGDHLRDAQTQLLAGGERQALSAAAAAERTLVEQLADAAEQQLADAGHANSAATRGKLLATLHAVATNPEARELLAQGRLVHEYEASDLGLVAVAPGDEVASVAHGGSVGRNAAGELRRIEQRLELARSRAADLARERGAAEREAQATRREASRAAAELQLAEAELARVRAARERAEAAAERAEDALARVAASAREADERVSELEAALREP
jgi:hypothetical protein